MKTSDSKGIQHLSLIVSHRLSPSLSQEVPFRGGEREMTLLEQYTETARQIRAVYEQVTKGTGKRGRGPKLIAVTQCVECHGLGLTTSKIEQKKRWACKTCGQTTLPVWTDGPVPDEDDIYEAWAKARPKAADDQVVAKGHGNFVRRHGCSIKKRGERCPLCDPA